MHNIYSGKSLQEIKIMLKLYKRLKRKWSEAANIVLLYQTHWSVQYLASKLFKGAQTSHIYFSAGIEAICGNDQSSY